MDKKTLADQAIYLERVLCNEAGGWQDQIAASYGGLNRIDFSEEGYQVSPILISPERKQRLNENLMLFFTGFTRFSSEIQKANQSSSPEDKLALLREMKGLVNEGADILCNKGRDLDDFGRLLHTTWELKRKTAKSISTDSIDQLYEIGMRAGALGGKLLGAGGGGFLLFYVEKEKQEGVMEAMRDLLYIPFSFENGGTQVDYYSPETFEKKV